MSAVVEAAKWAVEHNIPVTPVWRVDDEGNCRCRRPNCEKSAGKHAKLYQWEQDKNLLKDETSIADYFNNDGGHCNFGAVYGVPAPDGRIPFIWDIDVDNGKPGEQTMIELETDGYLFPETATLKTGGGGRQLIMYAPKGTKITNQRLLPGIDIKGARGYGLLPGSKSWKGDYSWILQADIADAPQWALDMITASKEVGLGEIPVGDLKKRDELTEDEIKACDEFEAEYVKKVVGRLQSLHGLAEGQTPTWGVATWGAAKDLLRLALSPWAALDPQGALGLIMGNAPRDASFDDDEVKGRIKSAINSVRGLGLKQPVVIPRLMELLKTEREPTDFFTTGKSPKLKTESLANAVLEMGPLGIGRDNKFWVYNSGVWVTGERLFSQRITSLLRDRYIGAHESNVRKFLEAHVPIIQCEPVKRYINFRNGMLDWRTGELLPHDPKYLSTVQLSCDWNPKAESYFFDKFVSEVMAADAVELYWQLFGYLLMNGNPMHLAYLFVGNGRNGKGVTLRTYQKVLGHDNVSNVTLDKLVESRFAGASLFGKVANIAGDIDATYMGKTAQFKAITGDDQIDAEHKFRDSFTFTPWAVPVFSANEFFTTSDSTHGFKARWIVLEFPNTFASSGDTGMEDRFDSELEGIAVKAVLALQGLMAKGVLASPESVQKTRQKFEQSIDPLERWLGDRTEDRRNLLREGPEYVDGRKQSLIERGQILGDETPSDSLYDNYEKWCLHENCHALGRNRFGGKIEQHGFTKRRTAPIETGPFAGKRTVVFAGLKLLPGIY